MFKNIISHQYQSTQSLTGLRAYAALAVFFIHSGGAGLRDLAFNYSSLNSYLNKLVDFGKYGVVIFFVLSAYTISMGLDKDKDINYANYIKKRLLRVLPMYYLMVLVAFFYGGVPEYFSQFQISNSWSNLLAHLSFYNLFDIKYRNNLLGVEWSIPLEIFYYLLVPSALILFRRVKNFGLHMLIVTLCIAFIGPFFLNFDFSEHRALAYHWSIVKYIFSFSVGLILYQLHKKYGKYFNDFNSLILTELLILLAIFIYLDTSYKEEFIALWSAAVILVIHKKSTLSQILFENQFVLILGTISYSFYLVHFPVLMLMKPFFTEPVSLFLVSLLTTSLISYFTYLFIEKPFINYSHKISSFK